MSYKEYEKNNAGFSIIQSDFKYIGNSMTIDTPIIMREKIAGKNGVPNGMIKVKR